MGNVGNMANMFLDYVSNMGNMGNMGNDNVLGLGYVGNMMFSSPRSRKELLLDNEHFVVKKWRNAAADASKFCLSI